MVSRLFYFAFLAALVFSARPAFAVDADLTEGYATPTYKEVMQSIIVLGGMDMNDPQVTDEYGRLVYCSLYRKYYKSDFEWNNIRRQMISRVIEKKEMYRVHYEITGVVKLGRYNFDAQSFPITDDTKLAGVGKMFIVDSSEVYNGKCPEPFKKADMFVLPSTLSLYLDRPLKLEHIPFAEGDAQALLARIQEMRIVDRSLIVRFRFRIIDVPHVAKDRRGRAETGDLKGEITSIDFFLDKEMTKWVGSAPVM